MLTCFNSRFLSLLGGGSCFLSRCYNRKVCVFSLFISHSCSLVPLSIFLYFSLPLWSSISISTSICFIEYFLFSPVGTFVLYPRVRLRVVHRNMRIMHIPDTYDHLTFYFCLRYGYDWFPLASIQVCMCASFFRFYFCLPQGNINIPLQSCLILPCDHRL